MCKSVSCRGKSVSCRGKSVSCRSKSVSCRGTSISCRGKSISCRGTSVSYRGTVAQLVAQQDALAVVDHLSEDHGVQSTFSTVASACTAQDSCKDQSRSTLPQQGHQHKKQDANCQSPHNFSTHTATTLFLYTKPAHYKQNCSPYLTLINQTPKEYFTWLLRALKKNVCLQHEVVQKRETVLLTHHILR